MAVFDIKAVRYKGPALADLDEQGCRLYFRACDLAARMWMNDVTIAEYETGNFEGCAMLVHAEAYLADRLAYELAPWPKGMIRIETDKDIRYRIEGMSEWGRRLQ